VVQKLVQKHIEGISSGQQARMYLNEHYEIPFSELRNNTMIRDAADKLKITFPDCV